MTNSSVVGLRNEIEYALYGDADWSGLDMATAAVVSEKIAPILARRLREAQEQQREADAVIVESIYPFGSSVLGDAPDKIARALRVAPIQGEQE